MFMILLTTPNCSTARFDESFVGGGGQASLADNFSKSWPTDSRKKSGGGFGTCVEFDGVGFFAEASAEVALFGDEALTIGWVKMGPLVGMNVFVVVAAEFVVVVLLLSEGIVTDVDVDNR